MKFKLTATVRPEHARDIRDIVSAEFVVEARSWAHAGAVSEAILRQIGLLGRSEWSVTYASADTAREKIAEIADMTQAEFDAYIAGTSL